jgi:DUF4097 and DUF4098 domain-containing protein YvlB
MLTAALIGVLALGMQQQTDTTFAVAAGGHLKLNALNGSVTVRTWERAAMRVHASHPRGVYVDIRSRSGVVSIGSSHGRAPQSSVTYEITVPRSFSIELEGVRLRTTVEGVHGAVRVSNAEGDIVVRGVTGNVEVESVAGGLLLEGIRGRVDASTVNQHIRLSDVRGDITAGTINGGITLRAIDARRVEATTVNGVLDYGGSIQDGGRYYLGAHNGHITMAVPENGNAVVSVSSRTGRVETEFPVPAGIARDGRISFTLGTGSASIELESFNGAVRLVRPRTR